MQTHSNCAQRCVCFLYSYYLYSYSNFFALHRSAHCSQALLTLNLNSFSPSSSFFTIDRLCLRRSSGEKHCCSYRAWKDSPSNHQCRCVCACVVRERVCVCVYECVFVCVLSYNPTSTPASLISTLLFFASSPSLPPFLPTFLLTFLLHSSHSLMHSLTH